MKVADVQQLLAAIGPFARAAGASEKAATEIERARQCLEPFRDRTLAEFNDFLNRADEFDRTGKLTAPPRAAARSRAPKAPKLTVEAAVPIFQALVARAADPTLTYEEIDAQLAGLDKLTVPQLRELASKVDVPVPAKAKKEIVAALTRWIKELKVSHERTQFNLGGAT